jgi:hypothetical protein
MTADDILIRRLIGGDATAVADVVARAGRTGEPVVLVAAALVGPDGRELLARASAAAVTTRDRQTVAIAAARLAGDTDRLDVLARDHLADFPGNLLVAWIASKEF